MSNRRCSVDGCRGWAFQNGLCRQHKKETKEEEKEKPVILPKSMNEKNDEILETKFDLYPMQWLDWFRQWRREGSTPTTFPLRTLIAQPGAGVSKWQHTNPSFGPGSSTWRVNSAILEPFGKVPRSLTSAPSECAQLIIVIGGLFTIWATDSSNGETGYPGSWYLLTDTWGQGHTFAAEADENLWLRILLSSSTLVSVSSCSSSPSDSSASSNSDPLSSSSPSPSSSFSTSNPTTDPDPTTTSTSS